MRANPSALDAAGAAHSARHSADVRSIDIANSTHERS